MLHCKFAQAKLGCWHLDPLVYATKIEDAYFKNYKKGKNQEIFGITQSKFRLYFRILF